MKKALIAVSLCFFMLLSLSLPAFAAESSPLYDRILQYKLRSAGASTVQEWIDGELTEQVGIGSEWYIMALAQTGEDYDFSGYAAALQRYLEENEVSGATTREKVAMTWQAIGYRSDFIAEAAADSIGGYGIMSWSYGLHVLNNGAEGAFTAEEVLSELLALQLEDGGWAISGDRSDADVTAMTLHAMAPYYRKGSAELDAAIDRGIDRLSGMQLENGGYRSYGTENVESADQVLCTLCALGIDPDTDPRFNKSEGSLMDAIALFVKEDGSVSHTIDGNPNETATRQTFYALVAYERLKAGKPGLFVFDRAGDGRSVAEHTEQAEPAGEEGQSAEALPEEEPARPAENHEPAPGKQTNYRGWMFAAVACAALLLCLLNLLRKKSVKNLLFILGVAAVLMGVIALIRVETPEQYYSAGETEGGETVSAVISIRCDTIVGEADFIPADGVVLAETEITVPAGSTAYDQLIAAAKEYGLLLDKEANSYIRSINNMAELEYGSLSGWMYCVNGSFADVNCGEYVLQEGDYVEWLYTRDIGHDIESRYDGGAAK